MRRLAALAGLLVGLLPAAALAQASPSDFTAGTRYDIANRVVGTIAPDPDGAGPLHYAAVRNTYDNEGRLITVEKGQLSSWQSETTLPSAWPGWNAATQTGFQIFSKVITTYDGLDRKILETTWGSADGGTTWVESAAVQYSYDVVGRLDCAAVRINPATWASLPASACTLATTSGIYGPDRITKNVYDDAGQLLKVIKAYGQTTANGLPQLQQDYVTYTYTDNGKQKTLKDADGNLTTYTYDGFDRLVAWAFPSKTVTGSSAPCTIGTIAEATDGFGNAVTGPSETRTAGDDCEKYAYDRDGNRAKLMKRDGNVIRYAYDALSRNTVKDIPGGTANDVYYAYDLRGLQTAALFASASGVGITNSYDGFGELIGTTNNMGTTARTLNYTYDADGNRSQLTYPDNSYFAYVYDGLDRLTTIKEAGATAIVSTVYDVQGRVGSQTRGAVTTTLGYDTVSRPTSWADDLAGTTSDVTSTFAYNPASQIVTKTRSNNAYAFNAYVSVSRPYAVNGLNQYATAGSATFTYDDNGNLTGDGTNSYGYDVENRMTSATTAIGTITIKYDPLGRLWQYSFPTKTWEHTYDGNAMVMAVNPSATLKFVHGPNEDNPMIQYTGSGYSARLSLQADYQGSIVSMADTTGAAMAINTYDEYGVSPSTNAGFFQYTGQMWLGQLGLYYYKARMYSPTLGRFMQTDPIGYEDQNNIYAYVGNDPIDGRDPTGNVAATGSLLAEGSGAGCEDEMSPCSTTFGDDFGGTDAHQTAQPKRPKDGGGSPGGAGGFLAPTAVAVDAATGLSVLTVSVLATPLFLSSDSRKEDQQQFLYRSITPTDAQNIKRGRGIWADNPDDRTITPSMHIENGGHGSSFISTTSNLARAELHDRRKGRRGVVVINRSMLNNTMDVGNNPIYYQLSFLAALYANNDKEVLVWRNIPQSAIVGLIPKVMGK